MTDQEKASAFYQEIKKDIVKFIPVALCTVGQVMEQTGAESMEASTDCTLNGKRYKVTGKFKISPL